MRLRVVTNSERGSFACERLWWLTYEEGLTRSVSAAPLRQGGLAHLGVEFIEAHEYECDDAMLKVHVIRPWLEKRYEYAEKSRDPEIMESLAEDEELARMTLEMLKGYIAAWKPWRDRFKLIALETQVARWIKHPGTGRPVYDFVMEREKRVRRRWAYGGKVDRIVLDREFGTVWTVETKTSIERDLRALCRKLHLDPQIRGYGWALQDPIAEVMDPAVLSAIEGVEIEGVIYDVMRKAVPGIPKPIKDLSRLSKQKIDTTREIFLAAVLANGFDPDDYADQLDALPGWESFFYRHRYPFTSSDYSDFGEDISTHALLMKEATKRSYHPRQPKLCTGIIRGCPAKMEALCLNDGPMARDGYRQKVIRHEELDGDLAEPWMGRVRGLSLVEKEPSEEGVLSAILGHDRVRVITDPSTFDDGNEPVFDLEDQPPREDDDPLADF